MLATRYGCCSLLIQTLCSTCLLADPPKPTEEKKPEPISEKHFAIFDAKGNPATLDTIAERMLTVSVVFLGEHHNDPVAHHLELVVLKKAHEQAQRTAKPPAAHPRPFALAVEMFERDVQGIVDEYLEGQITETHFKAASRPWKDYDRDYRSLIEYAREQRFPVLASNAPRRYVNRVSRLGADSLKDLSESARRGLPPLPYGEASPAYSAKFMALMKPKKKEDDKKPEPKSGEKKEEQKDKKPAPDHDPARGLAAQSLWDATMAYTIAEHLMRRPQAQIVHINGGFHSEHRMGIPEHLLRYRPGTSLLVVTMLPHKGFPKFDVDEHADRGDFVILTDPSLSKKDLVGPPARAK